MSEVDGRAVIGTPHTRDMARVAYETWQQERGVPGQTWELLPEDVQAHWETTARAVAVIQREQDAQLAERVKAGYAARCEDPAHRDMVHAIRVVKIAADGGHLMSFAELLRGGDGLDVARDAEVLHAEHHPGTFVPSLDSCPEHDRSWYEQRVRDLRQGGGGG